MNGLAVRDGQPSFVTAASQTDVADGWRGVMNGSGCIVDVVSGEAFSTGLSMPHSPRWHSDQLLVLNSGCCMLEAVDLDSGDRTPIVEVSGFPRGMGLHDDFAFIGLSRIRETAVFGDLPLASGHERLNCGVGVADVKSGRLVGVLEFESGVDEISNVQVLPNARNVALGQDRDENGALREHWVLPPDRARATSA